MESPTRGIKAQEGGSALLARIRTIKPSFWTDSNVAKLSHTERLLFIGLWNLADDKGRLLDDPEEIRACLFPYESLVKVNPMLSSIEANNMILRYQSDGKPYISIRNFLKHQKIDHPTPSYIPEPPTQIRGDIGEGSVSPHGVLNESSRWKEGKEGKEGKGKEEHIVSGTIVKKKQIVPASKTQEWPEDLKEVRQAIEKLEILPFFDDPTYWRRIEEATAHSEVAYLDEVAKCVLHFTSKGAGECPRSPRGWKSAFTRWINRSLTWEARREAAKGFDQSRIGKI